MTKARTLEWTVLLLGAFVLVTVIVLFTTTAGARENTAAQNNARGADFTASALRNFAKTSIKPQSGDTLVQAEVANITAPTNPFRFRQTARIAAINRVTITATIGEGDTGPGDFAENDLTLALDGIDTGIELNGFRNNETDTRTNSGVPLRKIALKNALKRDGRLQATIIDADPGVNNELSVPANFETTLRINGKIRR